MPFTTLANVLWATSLLGHLAVLSVLLVRGRWRKFPVFAGVLLYQVTETVVLGVIAHQGRWHAYSVAYWVLVFGDYGMQLALIWEIARSVLRPTGTWIRDARQSFFLWSAAGVLLAVGLAFTIGPPGSKGLDPWEARLTVFTSLLTCELFLAMSAAANRLGLPWRSHVMALAQGIMAWAAIALVGDLGHVILGWNRAFAVLDYARNLVYLGVLVFWGVAFWLPERARAPLSADMQEYLVALHRRVQYDLDRASAVDKPLL